MHTNAKAIDWDQIQHFSPSEFADPDVPDSWAYMAADTILELEALRERTGWQIVTHNKRGIRGCVCVEPTGHGSGSRHYISHREGCSAVDFHFACDVSRRAQAKAVMESQFTGIGFYYDWWWDGRLLPIGFHVDLRPRPLSQIWKRNGGDYVYFLR